MGRLPGSGATDGLFMYLLERLVQMPYLWWVWALVIFTCFIFCVLDNGTIKGKPQAIYGISLLVIMPFYNAETLSFGYFTVWVLGVGCLLLYRVLMYLPVQAEEF